MDSVKTSQIATSFDAGKPVTMTFHYHNKQILKFLSSVISKILSRNNLVYLQDTLITILREIIVNAVKANSKRFYFHSINMDIGDETQYFEGMSGFKDFIVEKQEFVEDSLKESPYRVTVSLKKMDGGIKVYVQNNTPIQPDELKRIRSRIEKARSYNDFSEVYCDVSDDTEGEGLGLVLTILFLRNSGIGEDSLKILSDGRVTQSTLTIPFQLKPLDFMTRIKEQIVDEVKSLPTFPENIMELQRLCQEPEVTIKQLADRIIIDPSLAASVLKLSNSAAFVTRKRIENISDAINIIGLKNLNAIIIASGARKILDERYSVFKQIWAHCNKTAFYGRIMAIKFGSSRISQNVYLAGLLHDLGKIVLLSISPGLSEWLSDFSQNRQLRSSTVIEEVSLGVSHSAIGQTIAEKWNLPDFLVEAIACHHAPLNTSEEHRMLVYLTYLADKLCGIEDRKFDYFFFEDDVLDTFGLDSEEKFGEFHQSMMQTYKDHAETLLM